MSLCYSSGNFLILSVISMHGEFIMKRGVLVLGHGSKLPYNREVVESVCSMLRQMRDDIMVVPAFMELCEPTIEDGLEELAKSGVSEVAVVPLFLAHGVHTLKDIPARLGLEDGKRECTYECGGVQLRIYYADPLGPAEAIARLVYERALEALGE
ncbi:MAG: sirohydrochlorin cobalto/nickelchelatase [Methanosarcinales archaeon]|nr:MAG: Sirohydrochlorin cobaltochelatase [Euryarchaeota archaeon 55_53]KUK30753.1 MAG: Sirohydrochlorin cobaltochelatase [Methanosarcinales archeaon 56_1174]MDI3488507.1 sirohydrochlorin cobalto/nickelchelatase [Methanosarcinales archaeon]MDN5295118.1 sirohydrochlorin cobalto/nickelchelatase [Methanosarcinales archaeon]